MLKVYFLGIEHMLYLLHMLNPCCTKSTCLSAAHTQFISLLYRAHAYLLHMLSVYFLLYRAHVIYCTCSMFVSLLYRAHAYLLHMLNVLFP